MCVSHYIMLLAGAGLLLDPMISLEGGLSPRERAKHVAGVQARAAAAARARVAAVKGRRASPPPKKKASPPPSKKRRSPSPSPPRKPSAAAAVARAAAEQARKKAIEQAVARQKAAEGVKIAPPQKPAPVVITSKHMTVGEILKQATPPYCDAYSGARECNGNTSSKDGQCAWDSSNDLCAPDAALKDSNGFLGFGKGPRRAAYESELPERRQRAAEAKLDKIGRKGVFDEGCLSLSKDRCGTGVSTGKCAYSKYYSRCIPKDIYDELGYTRFGTSDKAKQWLQAHPDLVGLPYLKSVIQGVRSVTYDAAGAVLTGQFFNPYIAGSLPGYLKGIFDMLSTGLGSVWSKIPMPEGGMAAVLQAVQSVPGVSALGEAMTSAYGAASGALGSVAGTIGSTTGVAYEAVMNTVFRPLFGYCVKFFMKIIELLGWAPTQAAADAGTAAAAGSSSIGSLQYWADWLTSSMQSAVDYVSPAASSVASSVSAAAKGVFSAFSNMAMSLLSVWYWLSVGKKGADLIKAVVGFVDSFFVPKGTRSRASLVIERILISILFLGMGIFLAGTISGAALIAPAAAAAAGSFSIFGASFTATVGVWPVLASLFWTTVQHVFYSMNVSDIWSAGQNLLVWLICGPSKWLWQKLRGKSVNVKEKQTWDAFAKLEGSGGAVTIQEANRLPGVKWAVGIPPEKEEEDGEGDPDVYN